MMITPVLYLWWLDAEVNDESRVRWCWHSAERLKQSGELPWAAFPPEELTLPDLTRICLFVPGQQVLSLQCDVPQLDSGVLQKAVSYELEDALLDDIEKLHIALGPSEDARQLPVLVISRHRIQQYWDAITRKNFVPGWLAPDYFLLPYSTDAVCLSCSANTVLWRAGRYHGATFPSDWVDLFQVLLQQADKSIWRWLGELPASWQLALGSDDAITVKHEPRNKPMELLETFAAEQAVPAINLFQYEFTPPSMSRPWWQRWSFFAVISFTALLIALVAVFALGQRYRQLADDFRNASLAIVKEYLPNQPVKPDIEAQVRRHIAAHEDKKRYGFLDIFTVFYTTLESEKMVPPPVVESMSYEDRNGALSISLTVVSIEALERIKAKIEQTAYYHCEIEFARQKDSLVAAQLRLTH